MKRSYHIKVFLFILLTLNYSCAGELGVPLDTSSSKTIDNINQGNILLFAGNFSEDNGVPGNAFVAKLQNNGTSIYYTHNLRDP